MCHLHGALGFKVCFPCPEPHSFSCLPCVCPVASPGPLLPVELQHPQGSHPLLAQEDWGTVEAWSQPTAHLAGPA